jgi:mannose-6-phosphate isomerase-like protein (cupin superfamily)
MKDANNNVKEYMESGILELYVMGAVTEEEAQQVETLAAQHPEVAREIEEISRALETYAEANAVAPHPNMKPFILAVINYTERLEGGEPMTFPPMLTDNAQIADYQEWLDRPDMVLSPDFEDVYAKIIGFTPEQTTAIVWIKHMAPEETHTDEYEKFLIVEGTCDIVIGADIHHLVPGDYLTIPLHVEHQVRVTSEIPCKVILQRVAA